MFLKPALVFILKVLIKLTLILNIVITKYFTHTSAFTWLIVEEGILKGYEIFGDPKSDLTQKVISGKYESFLFDGLKEAEIQLNGKTIWDVGAHFGYHTLSFSSAVGEGGKVIAFEPNPNNISIIQQHLERNPKSRKIVIIENAALSDRDMKHDFRYSPDLNISDLGFLDFGILPSDRIAPLLYSQFTSEKVSVYKGDTWVNEHKFPPHIIKIDVEGEEQRVLLGMQFIISTYKPILLIEVHNIRLMHFIAPFLTEHGYMSILLDDPYQSSSKAFILAQYKNPKSLL